MRSAFVIAMLGLMSVTIFAQQSSLSAPDIDVLLAKLRSNSGGERDSAYERLKAIPAALQNPKVKAALLDLLDRETQRMIGTPRLGDSEVGVGTEGFAEYYSELSSTASDIGDWDDPHQVCVLVRGAGTPPARSAQEAASRERVAWPCLQQMAVDHAPIERIAASRTLIELTRRAGSANDPAIGQNAKQTIVHLLHDQNESVRAETINSLEQFGTEDMISELKQVAESDPAVAKRTQNYWLRNRAAKAIVAIQKRSSQQQ